MKLSSVFLSILLLSLLLSDVQGIRFQNKFMSFVTLKISQGGVGDIGLSANFHSSGHRKLATLKICGLRRMGHSDTAECVSDKVECSETTIEIKIKTLDSQTYSLRVDKQILIPDLKEKIASVTGVLSEQQRLICRGRVLRDDQILSAYHVEDGHTLHLVVRQPPVTDGLASNPANDPNSSMSARQGRQVGPNVVNETLNMPEQADGSPAEITRIVSALLGSFGIPNIGFSPEAHIRENGPRRLERVQGQPDRSYNTFELPAEVSLGSLQHPVISDSLATLTQYRSHLSREFDAIGRDRGNNPQATRTEERESNPALVLGTVQGFSTPASLAELLLSTRQMLTEQAGELLLLLARQLNDQVNVTDPLVRDSAQSSAWRTGSLLHNLGAFLLELGRATMTLRLGESPSEAVVNAGPAVFISPSGPNPLMVQPFPFHLGTSFGAIPIGTIQSTSALGNGVGLHRGQIGLQIQRGPSMSIPNGNMEESGIRSETSGNSMGLYYPILGRVERVTSGHVIRRQAAQPSEEHHPAGEQTERQPITQSTVQPEHNEDQLRDGSLPSLGQQARSVDVSVLSREGVSSNQESEGQIPGSFMHLLRSFLPGGDIHIEDTNLHGTAIGSVAHTETSSGATNAPESELIASDEGIFLSNLLHKIMPFVSQIAGTDSNSVPNEEESASAERTADDSSNVAENSDVGTSRQNSDPDLIHPNSKRQKRD